jgi:hypothetical protein
MRSGERGQSMGEVCGDLPPHLDSKICSYLSDNINEFEKQNIV